MILTVEEQNEIFHGVEFNSSRLPEIELKKIFIRGENKKEDNKVAVFECEDEEQAKTSLKCYVEAVRECNNSLRKGNRDTEVEVIIAE